MLLQIIINSTRNSWTITTQPSQIGPNRPKQDQTGPNRTKQNQTGLNRTKPAQTCPNLPKQTQTGPNRPKQAQTGRNRPKQARTGSNRPKSYILLQKKSPTQNFIRKTLLTLHTHVPLNFPSNWYWSIILLLFYIHIKTLGDFCFIKVALITKPFLYYLW